MASVKMAAPRRGTRPRNRRALILEAARHLFVDVGYPQVSINDIATVVAITPPALYRHFRSKEDLLYETVASELAAVREALEADRPWAEQAAALAQVTLGHRGVGILWQRESRHLDPERRNELRAQLIELQRVLAQQLLGQRPGLSARDVDLLAWSTLTAAMSISFQRVELPDEEYMRLLTAIIDDVIQTDLPPPTAQMTPSRPTAAAVRPESTSDRLVQAALQLFADRGFKSVRINDVARAVGIAGPSAYSHFDSKVDLLSAAMGDGARLLLSEEVAILAEELAPPETLVRLLRSYVDFSFANHHLLDLMITETNSLRPAARAAGIQQQRDYVRAWVHVLQQFQPALPAEHARVRVQAVLTLVNDIARTAHLRSQRGVRDATAAIAESILGSGPSRGPGARAND